MANNGLITLHTDLKSLKYGSIPLGSDKPYVTKDIGQAPGSQIGAEISHRIDDVSRIAQMLVDKPGIKYLLNEALLQQVGAGDKIRKAQQGGKSLVRAVLQQAGSTLLNTVKIAGSTLAQVPVNGTGTHFLKGFRTDTYLRPGANEKIPGAFASFFGAGGVEGAQYALRGEVVPTNAETQLVNRNASAFNYLGDVYVDRNEIANPALPVSGSNKRQSKLNAESGTPIAVSPSESGIGQTTAKSGTKNPQSTIVSIDKVGITGSSLPNSLNNLPSSSYSDGSGYIKTDTQGNINTAVNGDTIYTEITPANLAASAITIQASKKDVVDPISSDEDVYTRGKKDSYKYGSTYTSESQNRQVDPSKPSRDVVKERRVGLGDQGARRDGSRSSNTYWELGNGTEVDTLNSQDISADRVPGAAAGRDLAKLYFEVITPEPADSRFLYFRAYIDSFDDGYNASWEARKYVGRAESFYTYGGFDRDITLSFKIAPATRSELKPLYKKMVYLASTTAPTYGTSGLMRGTLVKMTVGSYLDQVPGVITSVKYSLVDGTPWEIAMGQPEGVETDVQVLPMVIQCSISFKPIHTFAPQTGLYNYITSPQEGVRFFTEGDKL
jgi:hypothetical protein